MGSTLIAFAVISLAATLGYIAGALVQRRQWESRLIRVMLRDTKRVEQQSTAAAFARAARAVGLWPHRVTHRADLMRHLDSLATAPELGDCTPNPEAELLDATTPPVRPSIPSAAPVSGTATPDADHEPEPDDLDVVDVYRREGFL